MKSDFWTTEKEAKLRQMFEADAGYTAMMAALQCTKGTIAGKLTRLHLTNKAYGRADRRKGNRNNPHGRNGKDGKPQRNGHFALKDKSALPHLPKSLAHVPPRQHAESRGLIWQPSNGGDGVGFDERPEGTCAWPIAEPSRRWPPQWRSGPAGMICCAAPCAPDRPYCAMHAAVAVGDYEPEAVQL